MGVVSVVAIISKSLQNSFVSRDIIIASQLAQEGVEIVRNVRDNNFARNQPAFSGFSSGSCAVDYQNSGNSLACGGPGVRWLYGEGSFSRTVTIDLTGGGAVVRSFVWWDGFPGPGDTNSCNAETTCVYTETFLTDWKVNDTP